jgi:hypothetical protein
MSFSIEEILQLNMVSVFSFVLASIDNGMNLLDLQQFDGIPS